MSAGSVQFWFNFQAPKDKWAFFVAKFLCLDNIVLDKFSTFKEFWLNLGEKRLQSLIHFAWMKHS